MDGTIQGSTPGSGKDQMFRDVQAIGRSDDALQTTYSTRQVIERIWTEHFRPRIKIVAVVVAAMVVSALLTGAVPFFIKTAGDEIFVKHNQSMVYTITIACADDAGNSSTGIAEVRVPKSKGKKQ